MSLKTKLAMGVMTGALGLSLVGGGTYAAFTDTESVSESYAAGVLDIELHEKDGSNLGSKIEEGLFTTDLTNFKPGDKITKQIRIANHGSLSVGKVNIMADYKNFVDGTTTYDNDSVKAGGYIHDFADQIKVTIDPANDSQGKSFSGTLKELKNQSDFVIAGQQNKSLPKENNEESILAYIEDLTDHDPVTITLEFLNTEEDQNQFQGDQMDVEFKFVAHQQEGSEFNDGDKEDVLDSNAMEGN